MRKVFALLLLCSTLAFTQLAFAQRDKVYHSTAGFGITLSFSAMTHRPTIGLIAGVGAGVAKELWDAQHPKTHQASARDALATAAGSGAAFVMWKYAIARKRPKIAAVPQQKTPAPTAIDTKPASTTPAAAAATVGGGR